MLQITTCSSPEIYKLFTPPNNFCQYYTFLLRTPFQFTVQIWNGQIFDISCCQETEFLPWHALFYLQTDLQTNLTFKKILNKKLKSGRHQFSRTSGKNNSGISLLSLTLITIGKRLCLSKEIQSQEATLAHERPYGWMLDSPSLFY